MTPKIQSIILTVLTLAIGFVAGFMVNSLLFQHRVDQIRNRMGDPRGYIHHICQIVDASPEQCEEIQPILESHHPRMREINKRFGRDMRASLDSLAEQLAPILTPEQLEKLKKPMRRRKGRWDKSSPTGPPPPRRH